MTISTSSSYTRRSGVMTSRCRGTALRPGEGLGLLLRVGDGADHVEGLLWKIVVLAVEDLAEALHGVLDLDVLGRDAGEFLGDVHGLREEFLQLARPRHEQLVLVRQLVDAEDGDDVLKVLVALQHALDLAGRPVVLLADDRWIDRAARRRERIDRRIDPDLREI